MKIIFLFALILFSACSTDRSAPDQKHIIGIVFRTIEFGPCAGPAAPLGCFDPTPYPCLLAEGNIDRCEQDYARVPVEQKMSGTVGISSNKQATPGNGDEPMRSRSTLPYPAAGELER